MGVDRAPQEVLLGDNSFRFGGQRQQIVRYRLLKQRIEQLLEREVLSLISLQTIRFIGMTGQIVINLGPQ